MAELTPTERLQPSLLDRLTDEEPAQSSESRNRRVLSIQKLRESVLRDVAWLLNTTNLAESDLAERYPDVAKSVVNYGLPDLATKARVGAIREDEWNTPRTMYGCNKLYCEHLGRYYARFYKQLAAQASGRVDFRCVRCPGLISAMTSRPLSSWACLKVRGMIEGVVSC